MIMKVKFQSMVVEEWIFASSSIQHSKPSQESERLWNWNFNQVDCL